MEQQSGGTQPVGGQVRLRYWASARAAAGVESDLLEVSGPVRLADLLERARRQHSPRFGEVVGACSVLVDELPVSSTDPDEVLVPTGATVDLLPPFAGG